MKNVRIGGVPEHFNHPWHVAIEDSSFKKENINLIWTDYSTGTGAMCADLRSHEIDLAIVLTEGAVADIVKNEDFEILQFYVKSPLTWGVHTGSKSTIELVSPLQDKKIAISRFGSGSHLMSFVLAEEYDTNLRPENFVVVNNLPGAIESLSKFETDLFLWEKFTTKHCVDNGTFRRIAELDTPWPCFVIISRKNFILENKNEIDSILEIINLQTALAAKNIETPRLISERYNLELADVQNWYRSLEWSSDRKIESKTLEKVVTKLKELNIIDRKIEVKNLVSKLTELI